MEEHTSLDGYRLVPSEETLTSTLENDVDLLILMGVRLEPSSGRQIEELDAEVLRWSLGVLGMDNPDPETSLSFGVEHRNTVLFTNDVSLDHDRLSGILPIRVPITLVSGDLVNNKACGK